jgi:ankyrin repeat protein
MALAAATGGKGEEIVAMLVDNGVDVNIQNVLFGNLLQTAAFYGFKEIVRVLLGRGADVNARGGMMCAAQECTSNLQEATQHHTVTATF